MRRIFIFSLSNQNIDNPKFTVTLRCNFIVHSHLRGTYQINTDSKLTTLLHTARFLSATLGIPPLRALMYTWSKYRIIYSLLYFHINSVYVIRDHLIWLQTMAQLSIKLRRTFLKFSWCPHSRNNKPFIHCITTEGMYF